MLTFFCVFLRRHTNNDGRASAFMRWEDFSVGNYKMHFANGDYYKKRGLESFYPYAEVKSVINLLFGQTLLEPNLYLFSDRFRG